MTTRRSNTLRVVGLALLSAVPLEASKQPTLEEILGRAAEYHTTYAQRLSGVTLNEEAQVLDVTGGRTRGVIRISSDVVFVNLQGQVAALRDPFAVDTQALRPRTPRITALIAAPATPTSQDWDLVASYPAQGSIHFILDLQVKVNEPTTALQFISPTYQPSMKYRLDGRKTINDVETVGVRFEEPTGQDQFHVLGTRSNARATGRFWIDSLTGAIHQTELWVDSKLENAVVSVKCARHATLGLLLPTEMTETYEEREGGGAPRQMGRGADPRGSVPSRVSVQSRSIYSGATYSPIDLTKLR
ncbi:MAG: hypothetical protein FJW21_06335 [Acidimicrobiia bacterium]|nr:hypothetical protein [Acidimicrobiia bacterium]